MCLQTSLMCVLINIRKPTWRQTFQMIVKHVPCQWPPKTFCIVVKNQLKCLSLTWCKFVIDLVLFVIDLVYVCHWLYPGKQNKSCLRIIQVIVVDLVCCWPIRTPVAHLQASPWWLKDTHPSFYLSLQKCLEE